MWYTVGCMSTCNQSVGLANTRMSTDAWLCPKISPRSLINSFPASYLIDECFEQWRSTSNLDDDALQVSLAPSSSSRSHMFIPIGSTSCSLRTHASAASELHFGMGCLDVIISTCWGSMVWQAAEAGRIYLSIYLSISHKPQGCVETPAKLRNRSAGVDTRDVVLS
jgi:hypothetical protein